ncbi:MAG: hypothetical protein NXI27_15275 [Alphaproteobacteria bacterium]|nr:hypothetical protein [Alphaproteobacteria bacterium]
MWEIGYAALCFLDPVPNGHDNGIDPLWQIRRRRVFNLDNGSEFACAQHADLPIPEPRHVIIASSCRAISPPIHNRRMSQIVFTAVRNANWIVPRLFTPEAMAGRWSID